MLDKLLDSTNVPLLQKLAEFGERRHEVLAGNVANIDTPHYRRRDLPVEDFQAALKQAIESRNTQTVSRYAPEPRTLDSIFDPGLQVAQIADPANVLFQDGAERSIEADVLTMTKNLMTQSFAIELMSNQMNLLESVIREQA